MIACYELRPEFLPDPHLWLKLEAKLPILAKCSGLEMPGVKTLRLYNFCKMWELTHRLYRTGY